LIDCFDTPYRGSVRHLHLQSEILRYLAGLTDYLTQVGPGSHESDRLGPKALERAHALKDFLMLAEGKAPSMDKLALQFGRSSRALNDEFSEVFGQTIFGFLTQHRLELAYSAIVATDTPLKVIAERVGYAHVNHFSAAFKKRFGHPPGALRRSHSS
jgi:AraC-like DNA-binding protein